MQKSIIPNWLLPTSIEQSKLILNTYKLIVGKPLFDEIYSDEYRSYLLYHAPFVVVSHGTEDDPIFNYANLTAQQLWLIDWSDFVKLPSRLSAEIECVEDRQRLLEEASKNGFIDNYEGVRIASTGKRFRIEKVLLWNLISDEKEKVGQAALFRSWTTL